MICSDWNSSSINCQMSQSNAVDNHQAGGLGDWGGLGGAGVRRAKPLAIL